MQTDLGATQVPASPTPIPTGSSLVPPPPGEGAPQDRLGIELGFESLAFHLLPAGPTAQMHWSAGPQLPALPQPWAPSLYPRAGVHAPVSDQALCQLPMNGGWDQRPVEGGQS